MKKLNIYLTLLMLATLLTYCSCKKFIDIDPPKTELSRPTVFSSDGTATAAMMGIYSNMTIVPGLLFSGGVSFMGGISSDELTYYAADPTNQEFFNNVLTASNAGVRDLWTEAYATIYSSNAIIEGLEHSTGVSDPVKKQLLGESMFLRALEYFYLINLYGDTPLVLTTDYRANKIASRAAVSAVYTQVVTDLKQAQNLLPENYVDVANATTTQRIRPNRSVATALLARVLLYTKDWAGAEAQSTIVINNPAYHLETDFGQVFKINSAEAIWQVVPISPFLNTGEGYLFGQPSQVPFYGSLSNSQMNSFEAGDLRKTNWIRSYTAAGQTYYMPYKYKVYFSPTLSEYSVLLRLAEQYLVRAEARARLNNIDGARLDINTIRNRAGLSNTTANDAAALLAAIETERRNEFFAEMGHRWFDLKRNNRADAVLSAIKQNWKPGAVLFPIPLSDIQNNPNLSQNPGY